VEKKDKSSRQGKGPEMQRPDTEKAEPKPIIQLLGRQPDDPKK
jgi:hypothetical protein